MTLRRVLAWCSRAFLPICGVLAVFDWFGFVPGVLAALVLAWCLEGRP